jgi:hypothetical protein
VSENTAPRKVFRRKREKSNRGWRSPCCASVRPKGDEIKVDEMSWARRPMGKMRNAYSNLFEKPERKRPLGRPRRRQENNIRIDQA